MDSKKSEEHKEDDKGRDIEILDEFEFADYLMKDVLGYFQYVNASVQSASPEDRILRLPEKVLPLTRGWDITYSREILVKQMDEKFQFYHTRSSLIVLVGIFEVTVWSFVKRLKDENKIDKFGKKNKKYKNKKYSTLLEWVFDFVIPNKESLYRGTYKEAIDRLPEVCLDVDEARRLRNLFMHHRGLFDKETYGIKTVEVPGRQPKMRQEFLRRFLPADKQKIPSHLSHEEFTDYMKKFLKDLEQDVPVLLKPEEYIEYSRSHIELLHDLHDLIQRKYFHLTDSGYYYRTELPRLKLKEDEWNRLYHLDV